jgi:RND family efflux transporter MFP subunit
MIRAFSTVSLLLVLAASGGCRAKAEGKAELPPATGAGAPPLPTLPDVKAPPPTAPSAAAAGDTHATGTLYPRAEAQLAPSASGIIAEVRVDEGDRVKKGDVLFRQDTGDAELRRQQAAAALDAARVQQRAAKTELDRSRTLFEEKAMNRAQWDQIEARHDAAAAAVRQAAVALSMAQKALADATVRAPFDGVVTAKMKNVGEMATMMPPTIVVVVQDQSLLELRFRLPERSLMRVNAGSIVRAHFGALGITREAKVARVNPTIDVRTRTVEVVATLDNPDLQLKPGLLAEVELPAAAPAPAADARGGK